MTWKFQRPLGTFEGGTFTGQVDVTSPQLGVRQIRLKSAALAGQICCIERDAEAEPSAAAWPAKLADAYVRGRDLVASYQASDDWPFAPQIYWRTEQQPLSNNDVLGSLSLLISVSTHLLDTYPRISASSALAADDVLQVIPHDDDGARATSLTGHRESVLRPGPGAGCLLRRLPGGQISYAEIVPANDFRQLAVSHGSDGVCRARWELFAEFLEKGVIRRAQLLSVFMPREHDVELAAACCRQFSARPLPLTT